MSDPVVSVVIPTFNRAHLLERALTSVENQTFQDYEIIIADDGSQDETLEVVSRRQSRLGEERIHALWLRHGGPAAARNAGISASRGKVIAFLDSDDEWMPHHLETCTTAFGNSENLGMVFTDHIIQSTMRARTRAPYTSSRQERVRSIILRHTVILTSAVAVSRAALADVGLFSEQLRGTEDWELWVRIALAYPVAYCPEATVVIYQHPNNFSANPDSVALQIDAAAERICDLGISRFCRNREVRARSYLDIAALYAARPWRYRVLCNLVRASLLDPKSLLAGSTIRTGLRTLIGAHLYHGLVRVKNRYIKARI